MLSHWYLLFTFAVLLLLGRAASPRSPSAYDTTLEAHNFHRRSYISPSQTSAAYDFVIAGGGLAGLVLAARLSDDSNKTVLVIEAGPSGDDVADRINTPSGTYYQSLLGASPYDWTYTTVPQANVSARVLAQPRGKVLGGSSAVNGMYYVRPSKEEVNAWHDLIAFSNPSAADMWKWDSFFTALKGTETFTPPSTDIQQQMAIKYSQDSRGNSGKLQTTYPGYMVPVMGRWLPALSAVGISSNSDPDSGHNIGGFIATSTINHSNWTRSYSRSAYIDSLPPRQNLHILSNATVTRIVFSETNDPSGSKIVTAIKFSTGKGTDEQSVSVSKEAVLAGGAFGSPQILQVSGVGPRDVLQSANVTVLLELPGVGQHLMDHLSVPVYFNTSDETAGSIHTSGSDFSKSPIFNAFVNDGVAYINGSLLFAGDASFATFRSQIAYELPNSVATRVPSNDSQVIQGYQAIYQATSEKIQPTAGIVEILFSVNGAGVLAIQSALQQPLSQGRMYITSPSIYDSPTIDPQYLSHPADIVIFRQAIKLARLIAASAPLSVNITGEFLPGTQIQTDSDVEAYIRSYVASEFHPTGTCAMLPLEQGGVVDAKLKVYGVKNLRVVDSSVFPVSFCAHMMSSTYALAESAAGIILGDWGSTATVPLASPTSTVQKKNEAQAVTSCSGSLWLAVCIVAIASFLIAP